jgi:hypothetical protein
MAENATETPWYLRKSGETKTQTTTSEFNPNVYFNLTLPTTEQNKTFNIRILPPQPGEDSPFQERNYHKVKTKKLDFKTKKIVEGEVNVNCGGKDCPVCAYTQELWGLWNQAKEAGDTQTQKVYMDQIKEFQMRTAYVARVIDRENEAHGVKFWAFDKYNTPGGLIDQLTDLAAETIKDENVDYTDAKDGFDIKLKKYRGKSAVPSLGKQQPLSKDKDLAAQWLSDNRTVADVWKEKKQHNKFLTFVVAGKAAIFSKEENTWVEWRDRNSEESIQADCNAPVQTPTFTTPPPVFDTKGDVAPSDDLPF